MKDGIIVGIHSVGDLGVNHAAALDWVASVNFDSDTRESAFQRDDDIDIDERAHHFDVMYGDQQRDLVASYRTYGILQAESDQRMRTLAGSWADEEYDDYLPDLSDWKTYESDFQESPVSKGEELEPFSRITPGQTPPPPPTVARTPPSPFSESDEQVFGRVATAVSPSPAPTPKVAEPSPVSTGLAGLDATALASLIASAITQLGTSEVNIPLKNTLTKVSRVLSTPAPSLVPRLPEAWHQILASVGITVQRKAHTLSKAERYILVSKSVPESEITEYATAVSVYSSKKKSAKRSETPAPDIPGDSSAVPTA
jgi:hypothetical protein